MRTLLTRRAMLAALVTAAAARPSLSLAQAPRLAVIDWALFETVLALGAPVAAATELRQFRRIAVEPDVPGTLSDLGLRGSPNYELLSQIAPDLVLISNFYEYQRPALERIAPVLSLPVFHAGTPPFRLVEEAMRALGDTLSRTIEAARYIAGTHAELAATREQILPLADRPVFAISLGDSRHFRAFGADSLFGDVLARLGLRNAWTDPTSYSAAAPVGLEALARVPDASIVVVAPLPADVSRGLPDNALWTALPAVRQGRVAVIDPVNHFGGLPSARRFARLFAESSRGWVAHG